MTPITDMNDVDRIVSRLDNLDTDTMPERSLVVIDEAILAIRWLKNQLAGNMASFLAPRDHGEA